MTAIAVVDLTKSYGPVRAVDGVSFEVEVGEVYGLLGHNGAGKTTIVEILEGHREATSGHVEVLGFEPRRARGEFRDRIGIVLQSSGVEPELTVREALRVYGGVYRHPRPPEELIDLVGLDDKAEARIGSLSGGQRRRVDLALGLVGRPELLFLDEPTTGFDPEARRQSWSLIESLCRSGTTVVLTTHYLDEAEHLADRVGVLVDGRFVAQGRPADLIADRARSVISFTVPAGTDSIVPRLPAETSVITRDGRMFIAFESAEPTIDLHHLTAWALDNDLVLESLSVVRPSLEDVFLQLGEDHR